MTKKKPPDMEKRLPIDRDKITENPHNLPYGHSVSSAIIFPDDKDQIKTSVMSAMVEQTNVQMKQIFEQMEQLVNQANHLKERVFISEGIYGSEMGFKSLTGHIYHLYQKKEGGRLLSMIGPNEWARECKYEKYVDTARLMGDHKKEV